MAEMEMKKLRLARGGIKHRVTNIQKYMMETFLPSEEKEIEDLQTRFQVLEECRKSYDEIHHKIICMLDHEKDKDQLLAQMTKCDEFDEMYMQVHSLLRKNIKLLEKPSPIVPVVTNNYVAYV